MRRLGFLLGLGLASLPAWGKDSPGMVYHRTTVTIEAAAVPAPPFSEDTPWLNQPPAAPLRRALLQTDIRDPKLFGDPGWNELAPFARAQALLLPFPGTGPATLRIKGSFPPSDVLAVDGTGMVTAVFKSVDFAQSYVETETPASALMLLPTGSATRYGLVAGDRVSGKGLNLAPTPARAETPAAQP